MGVPFIKKYWNSKIWLPHGQPHLLARFSQVVGINQSSAPNIFLPCPPISKSPKTLGGEKFGRIPTFRGPVPQGPNHLPKITCEELRGPWKFCAGLFNESKSRALFCSDTQTHENQPWEFFLHMCEGEGGKLQTLQNFYLFTSWKIKAILTILKLLWTQKISSGNSNNRMSL